MNRTERPIDPESAAFARERRSFLRRALGLYNVPASGTLRPMALSTFLVFFSLFLGQCTEGQGEGLFPGPDFLLEGPFRFSVYYNDPGVDQFTGTDKEVDLQLVRMIDEAESTIDMAVYNFSRTSVIDALIRAEDRGIQVRMVGDVDETITSGYQSILRSNIPISLGNSSAIQHNKFAVIDKKYLFSGTGNMTDSGFIRNNNNFLILESDSLAAVYTAEFEQMYFGRYGSRKVALENYSQHVVNMTPVEVYFSPYDGDTAMNRLIGLVDNAKFEIQFMIFAFTHDELTSALIRAANRGVRVRGIHDFTFVRGVSEEAPRLYNAGRFLSAGPEVRYDGNEHVATLGFSSHGGKLHTKTMIIDGSIVATGSFNWSTNATQNNDENLLLIFSPRVASILQEQWQEVFRVSNPINGVLYETAGEAASPGEVVISEIMYGDGNDDWIELRNMTGRDIDLSHWVITFDNAETSHVPIPDQFNWYKPGVHSRHYSPGRLIIPAGGYFLLKGLTSSDLTTADNKISGTKNFSLNSSGFKIRLYDPTMRLIDEAWNNTALTVGTSSFPYHSMERRYSAGLALDGSLPASWCTSAGASGASGSQLDGDSAQIGSPNYSGSETPAAPTCL
ncbi:MAG: lamin tail domain-containing protein [Leptospiraceae bacterium]|nr:lamin tail domain-containing protein [Leptospiraceae bacterium]